MLPGQLMGSEIDEPSGLEIQLMMAFLHKKMEAEQNAKQQAMQQQQQPQRQQAAAEPSINRTMD